MVSLLAAVGAWVGATRRSLTVLVAVTAYACAASTHALVFMHFLHYYVKWPFLLVGLACLLDSELREGRRGAAFVTAGGLLAVCLALAAWTLWP